MTGANAPAKADDFFAPEVPQTQEGGETKVRKFNINFGPQHPAAHGLLRIVNHLLDVTTRAMDVGALTPPLWGFEEREKLMVFYERASGARMHANYFRVGGVRQDLPPELVLDIADWCTRVPKVFDDIEGLITNNRIFKQRNVDIGKVTREEALAWGL